MVKKNPTAKSMISLQKQAVWIRVINMAERHLQHPAMFVDDNWLGYETAPRFFCSIAIGGAIGRPH